MGISFYTFQTLNYIFAVYRRQIDAERNLVTFVAFVSWFPQLVAGPIERAPSLLPQIRRHRDVPRPDVIESGVTLILRGLFKKVVIGDSVAGFVNSVYAGPRGYSWVALGFASVGFAVLTVLASILLGRRLTSSSWPLALSKAASRRRCTARKPICARRECC